MTISVLYIHHSGVFGGAARSLLEMIQGFPHENVKAFLVCPKGNVSEVFSQNGINVIDCLGISQFDHTRYGYYRGLRWLILLREMVYLPFTFLAIYKSHKKFGHIDLIHLNEVTNFWSFLFIKFLFDCPIVMHVRSVQQDKVGTFRRKVIGWMLRNSDRVVAIDLTVANSICNMIEAEIIHNGFRLENDKIKFSKKNYMNNEFHKRPMRILFIGGLYVMKGVLDLLHAIKLCSECGMNIKFTIVGETPVKFSGLSGWFLSKLGFYFDVEHFCKSFIHQNKLSEYVNLVGFSLDIENYIKDSDVLCFPSHLNAVGRPVIEAAIFGKPSIVAIDHLAEDMIKDFETGICIKEKNPESIFEAIKYYYDNPREIGRMGLNSKVLAMNNFNSSKNAIKMLSIYKEILDV